MKVTIGKYTSEVFNVSALLTFVGNLLGEKFKDEWAVGTRANKVVFIHDESGDSSDSKELTIEEDFENLVYLIKIFGRYFGTKRTVSIRTIFGYYFRAKTSLTFSAFVAEVPEVKINSFTMSCYNMMLCDLLRSNIDYFFVVKGYRAIGSRIYFEGSQGIRTFYFILRDTGDSYYRKYLNANANLAGDLTEEILREKGFIALPELLEKINLECGSYFMRQGLTIPPKRTRLAY